MTGKDTRQQKAAQEVWRKGYDTKHPDMVCPRGQSSSLVFQGPPSSGHLRTACANEAPANICAQAHLLPGPVRRAVGHTSDTRIPGRGRKKGHLRGAGTGKGPGSPGGGASEPSPGGVGVVAGEGDPDEI